MKNLTQHIQEKLQITRNKKVNNYTLFPETKEELQEMIESEIKKNGNECSLNHIDVSKITDMSLTFYNSKFNGDISNWDVSNVTNMDSMFESSKFTGENSDISGWDVSNVKDMESMFAYSEFNGDISNWNVNPDANFNSMFKYNNVFFQDLSSWKINRNNKDISYMFYCTQIAYKNNMKPKKI